MKILISAAETSSDAHGASLLRQLRIQAGGRPLDVFGLGGPRLTAEGLRAVDDARGLLAMGFGEAAGRLPAIIRAFDRVARAAKRECPDVAVLIDYPEFHLRLARRLKKMGIPVVYFNPPKVWAWRQHRARILGRLADRILCIFPFEEEFYRARGVEAMYVGHPMSEQLPLDMTRAQARAALGLPAEGRVIAVLPGSRPAELKHHLLPSLEAVALAARELARRGGGAGEARQGGTPNNGVTAVLPVPTTLPIEEYRRQAMDWVSAHAPWMELRVFEGRSAECLRAADAGVVKSGTATLEAALLECPHLVIYRGSSLGEWIFRNWVRYRGPVAMSNLWLEGPDSTREMRMFREFLGQDAPVSEMAAELLRLLTDEKRVAEQRAAMDVIRGKVLAGGGSGEGRKTPSELAAEQVLGVAAASAAKPVNEKIVDVGDGWSSKVYWVASAFWSTLNALARYLAARGFFGVRRIDSRVISVGNIQVGGAGKTPLVAQIAREAAQRGKTVCILCRGYGSEWESAGGVIAPGASTPETRICGDEAALLHDLAPEAWIGVGADRYGQYREVCARARAAGGRAIDLVVLDDGFQNWRIKKDFDVVAVTSTDRTRTLFRDWDQALRRADLVVWTKGDARPQVFGKPLVRVKYRLPREDAGAVAGTWDEKIWLVTGLADDRSVRQSAEDAGYTVVKHVTFPDHVRYREEVVRKLLREARAAGARVAVTGKDWVKWREYGGDGRRLKSGGRVETRLFGDEPVVVLEPELAFEEGRDLWVRKLWDTSP